MLGTALHFAAEAEIVAIDLLGLLHVTLVEKQCRQRMAGRVHPRPWLGVGEVVIQLDCLAQMAIGLLVPALQAKLAVAVAKADVAISSSCLCRTSVQAAPSCCH